MKMALSFACCINVWALNAGLALPLVSHIHPKPSAEVAPFTFPQIEFLSSKLGTCF